MHLPIRILRPALTPPQAVAGSMLAALAVGTVLLRLPLSTPDPEHQATAHETLFTAVSALSVTGLIVVDTPTFWSPFGHGVILALIQIGGFGMMSLATLLGFAIARRTGLRSRITVAEALGTDFGTAARMLRNIALVTLSVESTGALLLTARLFYHYGYATGDALWHGVFHSVSAFNNAGFALYTDSLMGFADDPFMLLVLTAEIVLGGLGFPVVMELLRRWHLPRLWTMNTRLVLFGTALLLTGGTVAVLALEYSNPATLGTMDNGQKLLNAFFQSVVARTAGFNAVDVSAMSEPTWLALDILMFAGAGPAGTAGGIKVTTALVVMFIAISELRADPFVLIFGKRLSRSVHRQAITVVVVFFGLLMAATSLLLVLEPFGLSRILFEVISAMSTTGLSTGITADLRPVSQLVLVVLMFVGRVGPVTVGAALVLRRRPLLYEPPKERPYIG